MSYNPSRRDVLIAGTAAAVGLSLSGEAQAQEPKKGKRLRFGIIGAGGKGWSDMEDAARFGDIVAVCDIDVERRSKAMLQHPDAATFSDFRVMLERMGDQIDAVTVSTPDHTHAVAAAMAIRAGKHVFCQKPLTRTIYEARRLAELAKQYKVQTQMGNQGTASDNLRKVAALIKSGAFGKVKEVHCWTDRAGGYWRQGIERYPTKRAPSGVDFNLWCGPSPYRMFADGYHPFHWRGWWDFGSGALGDIGCHAMNLPFAALDLRDPLAVVAETSGHNRDSYPAWSIVTYEFGKRGKRDPLTMKWYDGGKRPPEEIAPGIKWEVNGSIIVCEKATLYSPREYGTETQIVGGGTLPEIEFEKSPGHFDEWVRAIETGKPAMSNFPNYSGPLTETVLLGNLAVWASGERVEWDARAMKTKGTDKFDSLIRPVYRPGWDL